MRNISFAWTTGALVAGEKTVTRRLWKDTYARSFRSGELVAAYDKRPDFGGKQVATIRLTCDPYLELTSAAPDSDYVAEGFAFLEIAAPGARIDGKTPRELWEEWREHAPRTMWVVRFELVSVDGAPGAQSAPARVAAEVRDG